MKWNDAMIRMRTHGTRSSVVSCHFIVIACIASRGCFLYVSGCSVMVSTCVCGLMAFYVEDRSCAHEQQHITGLLSKLPKRSLLLFYSYLFWIETKKKMFQRKNIRSTTTNNNKNDERFRGMYVRDPWILLFCIIIFLVGCTPSSTCQNIIINRARGAICRSMIALLI